MMDERHYCFDLFLFPTLHGQSTVLMNASFDVIIVGAGVAGCAMAYSLGLDGKKVLLIGIQVSFSQH